jgi:hypothetical protein
VTALVGAGWTLAHAGGRWCALALILALQFLQFSLSALIQDSMRDPPSSRLVDGTGEAGRAPHAWFPKPGNLSGKRGLSCWVDALLMGGDAETVSTIWTGGSGHAL